MLNVDFKIVMWNGGAIQNFNLVINQLPLSIFVSLVPSRGGVLEDVLGLEDVLEDTF